MPDSYDDIYRQRGAEEAFRVAVDDARKLRAELDRRERLLQAFLILRKSDETIGPRLDAWQKNVDELIGQPKGEG